MNTASASSSSTPAWLSGLLHFVERAGNRLPDPVTLFAILALLALIASAASAAIGVSAIHPVTGQPVQVVNLLTAAGIRQVLVNVVPNFVNFAPLGTVLVAMIGIGVAERTGLFAALLRSLVMAVPRSLITPTLIFAGIMSNTAADAGYVILPPLAAMLYVSMGRHPLAGVAAVFAGIGGGFSANLLITAIDPLLAGITTEAAQLIDEDYVVQATASYYLMAVSVVLLTGLGSWISIRIVEPHLGPWTADAPGAVATDTVTPLTDVERRGLWWAGGATVVTLLVIASLVVLPGAPLHASEEHGWTAFYDSLVGLLAVFFAVPGLTYGWVTRQVSSDRDAARMMSETMAAMGTYIVMAFFAGQFIAYFKWSNLGLILAIKGADLLRTANLQGVPLMIGFVAVAALINLFMASASAKWAIMAPVFVPMCMLLGLSPESTQGLYRVGDSVTNMITPLNYYLPILIAVTRVYLPDARLGTLIAAMLPYSLAYAVGWTALIVAWMLLGLPVGPGAPLGYPGGGA